LRPKTGTAHEQHDQQQQARCQTKVTAYFVKALWLCMKCGIEALIEFYLKDHDQAFHHRACCDHLSLKRTTVVFFIAI
jgi:hypothetical protein